MSSGRSLAGGKKSSTRNPEARRACIRSALASSRVATSASVVPERSASRSPNENSLRRPASNSSLSRPTALLVVAAESAVRAPLTVKWLTQSWRPRSVVLSSTTPALLARGPSSGAPTKRASWTWPSTTPSATSAVRFSTTGEPLALRSCAAAKAVSSARAKRSSPFGAASSAFSSRSISCSIAARIAAPSSSPQNRATMPGGSSTRE